MSRPAGQLRLVEVTRMKAQAGVLGVVVILALALAPGAAAAGASSRVQSDIVMASSSEYDEVTGESRSLIIEVLAVAGQPAIIYYGRYEDRLITCPDGWDGYEMTSVDGLGEGTLAIGRDLRAARFSGRLELQTITMTSCDDEEPTISDVTEAAIEGALAGIGPRLMESQAQALRLLPGANVHWQGRMMARQGVGSFELGGEPVEIGDAVFGRLAEVVHISGHALALPSLARAAMTASAIGSDELRGSAVFAQLVSDEWAEDSYAGMFVGALRVKGGETFVELHEYAEREVLCEGGWMAWDGVYRDGWGTGRLDVPPRYASASFTATLDLLTTTFDGCTGEESSTIQEAVPVGGTLTGSGPMVQASSRLMVRLGPGAVVREQVREMGRSATGSLTIGAETFEDLYGAIGRQQWRVR